MQENTAAVTRREFIRRLVPAWLTWNRLKAIACAAALIGLAYLSVSTFRELGFAGTIKTAGGFMVLLALAYLVGRASEIAEEMFSRCPKVVKAFLRSSGRVASYALFGLCGIYVFEEWKANGDLGQFLIPLFIFFALQFRNELEKPD